jgi:hypothetical protein
MELKEKNRWKWCKAKAMGKADRLAERAGGLHCTEYVVYTNTAALY